MTNLEKIRSMSAEELAKFLDCNPICEMCINKKRKCSDFDFRCYNGILKWLNKEADNG